MGVAGGHHRFTQLVGDLYDPFVDGSEIVFGLHSLTFEVVFFLGHEAVVYYGLDLQIVIS